MSKKISADEVIEKLLEKLNDANKKIKEIETKKDEGDSNDKKLDYEKILKSLDEKEKVIDELKKENIKKDNDIKNLVKKPGKSIKKSILDEIEEMIK